MRNVLMFLCASMAVLVASGQDFRLVGTTIGGAEGYGTIFSLIPGETQATVHYKFLGNTNGSNPFSSVIVGADGDLYGTNYRGGIRALGTVYKVKKDGTGFKVLHSFTGGTDGSEPYGGVTQASDGYIYGTTPRGAQGGIIFKLATDGTGYTKIYTFDGINGSSPQDGVIEGADGYLYGVTTQGGANGDGVIYKIKTDGTGFIRLFNFNGTASGPTGKLLQVPSGKLFGVTTRGSGNFNGILYSINPDGTGFTKHLDFTGPNGESPMGQLALGTDGKIYGVTHGGGANVGIIYRINQDGTLFENIYTFSNPSGNQPVAGVVFNSAGDLVGTTAVGGNNDRGTLFTVKKDGSMFTKVLDFTRTQAFFPNGIVVGPDGNYYGTTPYGGASDNGGVFQVKPDGTFTRLTEYPGEPRTSRSKLIRGSNGDLYGYSVAGGIYGFGAVSKIKVDNMTSTSLHDFSGANYNDQSSSALIQATNGDLYGCTEYGGATDNGHIFRINPNTGAYLNIHDFNTLASHPKAGVMQAASGELFGTTAFGGANGNGRIFRIDLNGGNFTTVFDFDETLTGKSPNGLIQASDGTLYGMCAEGGAHGQGTIYKIQTNGSGFTKLLDFDASITGSYPKGELTLTSPTQLFGVTSSGGNGGGALFSIHTDGTAFTRNVDFNIANGYDPDSGSLTLAPDGYLYGMTYTGGQDTELGGVVFRIKADGTNFSKVLDLTATTGQFPLTTSLLLVNLTPQTISFPALENKVIGASPFQLAATSSLGKPVTYSVSNEAVLSLSGNTATILAMGPVTITARQVGDFYNQSATAQQTICINPPKPRVTFQEANPTKMTSSSGTDNQWYLNGVAIAGAIGASYIPSKLGDYTVKVSINGCASEASDVTKISVITGDLESRIGDGKFLAYPNPANEKIAIVLDEFDETMPVSLRIFDFTGRPLETTTGNGGETNIIDISSYPVGSFLIKAIQNDKSRSAIFFKQ